MKKSFWAMALLLCVSVFFLSACSDQEDNVISNEAISEEVSKVSLQRLAEMNFDQSVSSGLYDDIQNRVSSLSQDDYDKYFAFWVEVGIQKSIDKGFLSQNQKDIEIQKEYQQRKLYDQKAQQFYSVPMYKLDVKKQFDVLDKIKEEKRIQSGDIVSYKSSCPKYYYPNKVSDDGSGTYSCVGIYSATNVADTDCDWEFAYNLGNNLTYGKVKTSITAAGIFLAGGINYRRPSIPENKDHRRFLVGFDRIDWAYPGSGYPAAQLFAADVKFRGLT